MIKKMEILILKKIQALLGLVLTILVVQPDVAKHTQQYPLHTNYGAIEFSFQPRGYIGGYVKSKTDSPAIAGVRVSVGETHTQSDSLGHTV